MRRPEGRGVSRRRRLRANPADPPRVKIAAWALRLVERLP
jgi:hypothetical protein